MASVRSLAGVSAGLVLLLVGLAVFSGDRPKETTNLTKPSVNGAVIDLQVKPASNAPQPLNFNLQGSQAVDQDAQGGLQKQQTDNALQPNAKIPNFQNN